MLKTHRIIPLVFILFFFGFTLITVAPVFAQGQWDKSMGMRHPDRPCMKNAREKGPRFGCGPDMRSPEQIASDPYDTNHPKSQEARANQADSPKKGFSSFGRTPKREVADSPKKGFSSFGRTPEEENQDSSGHFERRLQRKDKLGDSQTRKGKELQRIKEQKEEQKKQDKAVQEKFYMDSFKSGQLFEACGSLRQARDARNVRQVERVQDAFTSYCRSASRGFSNAGLISCDTNLIGPHVIQGLVHQNNLLDAVYPVFCGWMDLKAKAPPQR